MKYANWLGEKYDILIKDIMFFDMFYEFGIKKIEGEYYIEAFGKGIDLVFSKSSNLISIHFHKSGIYGTYMGELPKFINFEMSRKLINTHLGSSNNSGGGEFISLYGIIPYWVRIFHFIFNIILKCQK
jgi:hypothetical protein